MHNESIWLNVPESRVRVEESLECGVGRICEMHYHDEIELLLIRKGAVSCVVDGREYPAKAGEVLIVNSRVPHYTLSRENGSRYLLLQFRMGEYREDAFLSDLYAYQITGQVPARSLTDLTIADAMEKIFLESGNREQAYNYVIKSCVYLILARLIRHEILPNPEQSINRTGIKRLRPVLDYIDKNYAAALSLEEAGAILGLNPSYFCRLFRSVTGSTFTEYLNYVRVRHSEVLLRTTNENITAVSTDVGFSSVTYYNRVFKKLMNCTPSVYRLLRYRNI